MSLRHDGSEVEAPERVPASAVIEGPVPMEGVEFMGSMVKSESSAVVVQYFVNYCITSSVHICVPNMQKLHSRAHGELSVHEVLKELEFWGIKANVNLSFEDSQHSIVQIIRGLSDNTQEVSTSLGVEEESG